MRIDLNHIYPYKYYIIKAFLNFIKYAFVPFLLI